MFHNVKFGASRKFILIELADKNDNFRKFPNFRVSLVQVIETFPYGRHTHYLPIEICYSHYEI
jgi:hypothetical protein